MSNLNYKIGKAPEEEHLMLDFEDSLTRTVEERIELGLIPIKLPLFNDASYRVFTTMQEYRTWAERTLPRYLGYYRSNG
ncbi:MAG: hypothetical protein HY707_04260 [Ignavibacteriae bacterium]|nr:hypothetical protein [Ignavibacteriota bacterium]